MSTSWIDIADSAVKIGLGGIIGGVATLIAGMQRNRHELATERIATERERERELRSNRRRLLETATASVEIFFRLHETVAREAEGAALRIADQHNPVTANEREWYRKAFRVLCDKDYVAAADEARAQITTLKLASASGAAEALKIAISTALGYRDTLAGPKSDGIIPSVDVATKARTEFREKCSLFEKELVAYYDKI
ncbi:hypothetical protein R75461_07965 [Paraburkholderia nemoris]|uniref:hypothetical protein n=1 Tax=Paraburkholderia nemoris TaxID=2793076 RepID=UPI00190C716A|nr:MULTISPECIES: hypothetical protein [Paraburkholderia]MBK3786738.1 hypothetical protein [Paraburkholderia aspalathi]CAE6860712.1 hypothetical protein R75461_07965 [Paraburkholderia nemoris]